MHVVARQLQLLQVRTHRLGGVAVLPQRGDSRAVRALRQLLSVGADEEAVVDHLRRLRAERTMQRGVQLLVRPVIRTADDVRDAEVDVVDDGREMERRRAVVAPEHHTVEPLWQRRLLRCCQMTLRALALAHRPLVPLDPEPAQVLDDRLLSAREVPGGVGVVDAQQEPVSEAPVRDGAQRVADVERPGRARSEPHPHHQSVAAASSKWSTYCVECRPGTRSAAAVHTTRKQVDNTNESVNPVTVG